INIARGRDTGVPSLNAARRQFHAATSDSQLAPYISWADFAGNLKHAESLVNFIAAYGTHPAVAGEATLAGKRAAATLLVLGGPGEPVDRLDFLNSTGAWASGPDGVTITGLDDVDFWIGGLAERIMPFGGMLGSTFNFVFETQLEALQNGDRFYYLHRTPGLNFLTELENNSFAKLIAANTDAQHLPALVFLAAGLTLEVDQAHQFNEGLGNADPDGDVIRDNPATPCDDTNYLQYTGDEHVVLGGTDGDDTLIASIGDDTIWGDQGNDRIEGGFGNDTVEAGPGDDIITDIGGDDVIKGDDGNDVIHAGNGLNLILGGHGNDFIVTGEDASETFAGPGNDFILGARLDAFPSGNEGDDWIERGTADGAAGDNFDPLGFDEIAGNDVFLGDGGFDENLGEGGDDIVVGSEGPDKHKLASGFDWVTFKDDRFGVRADMYKDANIDTPLPASLAAIDNRFAQVEGLSGSAFNDILRGDDADSLTLPLAGMQGSVLTNIALISGLQEFLGAGVTSFGAGNILLGGAGSDIIEGRGGDDLIDGDRWLNVRISVRANADGSGPEIRSVDRMADLVDDMLSGAINPGQLVIVREILTAGGPDVDTAVFSDVRANYDITTVDGVTTVTHVVGPDGNEGTDGTDRLTNIERLQFADQTVVLVDGLNAEPVGQVAILDETNAPESDPAVGQLLRASIAGVTDADNPGGGAVTGPVTYTWQYEPIPGTGAFRDISLGLAPRAAATAVGPTFTVTPDLEGSALRVKAHYQDANGVLETVFSAPTDPVAAGAPAPGTQPLLTDEQPGVTSPGIHFLGSDLQFILEQIIIAERHAAGEDLLDLLPNARMALGLRTVDGSLNNLIPGQTDFGAADTTFPRMLNPVFRPAQTVTVVIPGVGPVQVATSYGQTSGTVQDSDPRLISNLIVDQTGSNPAAVAAATAEGGVLVSGLRTDGTPFEVFFIPNAAPDEGLSAPFNAWMTFFGQFFDHGLDLVNKGQSGTIFMPLLPDDPLFDAGPDGIPGNDDDGPNFMILDRATNLPGPDGILGTADDIHEHINQTTPFVDQNQTYTSHPSHQVFLRAYAFNAGGEPVDTG
ncbi:MAG: heme peroxidase, partial [Planctomycetes bacterium]|nr:heme peroxidase [Planctomycetota bacterium]